MLSRLRDDVTRGQKNPTALLEDVILKMVKSCAVFNCTQRYEKGVSFHQFPGDPELLKQWLLVMKQEEWTPTKFSLICSKHFTEDCYEKNGWSSQRKLKATAVPSVFNFTEKFDIRKKLRPRAYEKNLPDSRSTKSSAKDSKGREVNNGTQLKKKKGKLTNKNEPPVKCSSTSKLTHKNEIKELEEKNKLLKKKLYNLKSLVKYLKERNPTGKAVSRASRRTNR